MMKSLFLCNDVVESRALFGLASSRRIFATLFLFVVLLSCSVAHADQLQGVWGGRYTCSFPSARIEADGEITILQTGRVVRGNERIEALVGLKFPFSEEPTYYFLNGDFEANAGQVRLAAREVFNVPKVMVRSRERPLNGRVYSRLVARLDPRGVATVEATERYCEWTALEKRQTRRYDIDVSRIESDRFPDPAQWLPENINRSVSENRQVDRLTGVWRGSFRCMQHGTYNAEIALRVDTGGKIEGTLAFVASSPIPPGGSAQRHYQLGAYELVGTIDPRIGTFELAAAAWIEQVDGFEPFGFQGAYDALQDSVSLQSGGRQCFDLAFIRSPQARLFEHATKHLGLNEHELAAKLGMAIMPRLDQPEAILDGEVTTSEIYLDIRNSEYLKLAYERCVQGRIRESTGDPRQRENRAREFCDDSRRRNTWDQLFHFSAMQVKPGSKQEDWSRGTLAGSVRSLEGGRFGLALRAGSELQCFVIKEINDVGFGYEPIPMRKGNTDLERYGVSLIRLRDEREEARLKEALANARSRKSEAEREVDRLERAMKDSGAWNGEICQRPTSDPVLPPEPSVPDRELVGTIAEAACYGALERKLNPLEAHSAMIALGSKDVIGTYKWWRGGKVENPACINDMPARIDGRLHQGASGSSGIRTSFEQCVTAQLDECMKPLTLHRQEVASVRAAHIAPFNLCEESWQRLPSARSAHASATETLQDAQRALTEFEAIEAAKPEVLSLERATCE